jgi:hypothetical protein
VMWDKSNLISVRLETMLVSVQDSYAVCAERTTGSEFFLDIAMELRGDVGHVGSRFGPFEYCVSVGPFGDSANLNAR